MGFNLGDLDIRLLDNWGNQTSIDSTKEMNKGMPEHSLEVSWELVGEGGNKLMGESTTFTRGDTIVTRPSAGKAAGKGRGKAPNGPAEEGAAEEEDEEANTSDRELAHFRMSNIPLIASRVQQTVTLKLSAKYRYATKDRKDKESTPESQVYVSCA